MQLSKHFTLETYCQSSVAQALGIHNQIEDSALLEAAMRTCEMMERIRTFLSVQRGHEVAIMCLSGYRSPALNRVTRGAMVSSDHIRAAAMDWICPDFGSTRTLARFLAPAVDQLQIGQMTLFYPGTTDSHIHCSTIRPMLPGARIMTHDARGYHPHLED